ncbi:hypothetical protein TWF281_003482 [Arthrobotrys megalospora]
MAESVIENYTVGWICALQEEYDAACRMLDDEFDLSDKLDISIKDDNTYAYGVINGHYVVIGCLPVGCYGTVSAATVAKDMIRSFPNLRFALMVGIAGGAPTPENDVRLGDVVVSQPGRDHGGVVQLDLGKQLQGEGEQFQRTGQLNSPPSVLLGAMTQLLRVHRDPKKPNKLAEHTKLMDDMLDFRRPALEQDRLYETDYLHQSEDKTCLNCQAGRVVSRPRRTGNRGFMIHYGTIASSNTLMRDAVERDRYARELNILCFEMEAAGLMNSLPCLVVRGICDYSDSHKNDEWRNYAALTAAAYARELLHILRPAKVKEMPSWAVEVGTLLKGIQEDVLDIKKNTDNMNRRQRLEEEERVIEWLTPTDYGSQQSDFLSRRYPGTGTWLLESKEYRKWVEATSGGTTLFCPGIPGAGKTILTSIVINDLLGKYKDDPETGIAYVYFNFKRQIREDEFLAYLLKRLSQASSVLPENVRKLYDQHKKGKTRPTIEEIWVALGSVMAMYQRLFIAIDALDECQIHEVGGCRGRILDRLFKLQSGHKVNIFATSRYILDITTRFKDERSTMLEIRAHNEDIRGYLDGQISQSKRALLESHQEEIKEEITKAVDGMFLLAQLHFKHICTRMSRKKLVAALKALPTGSEAYHEAYNEAMQRITSQDKESRELAMNVISWITCSMRPLTIIELQHALALGPEEMDADKIELDEGNISNVEDIISTCAGLVTIDEESRTIRLVHYTTQQYFEQTKEEWFPQAEANIAETCASYLSLEAIKAEAEIYREGEGQPWAYDYPLDIRDRLGSYPFYEYAARNWGHHARKTSQECHRVMKFLSCQSLLEKSIQVTISNIPAGYLGVTALHMAAFFGAVGIAKALLKLEGAGDVNVEDYVGRTPLYFAVLCGHCEVAELLVGQPNIDPDYKMKLGKNSFKWLTKYPRYTNQTALSLAAEIGHSDCVQTFLKVPGINPNSEAFDINEDTIWTPLLLAAENGHEGVARILLQDPRVDPNFSTRKFSTRVQTGSGNMFGPKRCGAPLSLSAARGFERLVKLLLSDPRVDPDIKVSDTKREGWTPLFFAAEGGHEAVVKLLLQHPSVDPEVRAKTRRYYPIHEMEVETPLSVAVRSGHDTVVELLIADPRVDVNFRSERGQTPLSRAAGNGHTMIIRHLLAHKDIDVNKQDSDGPTALYQASEVGHVDIVRMLLEHERIDVNQRCGRATVLISASSEGNRAIVRALLTHKSIDIHIEDSYGKTALSYAEDRGHTKIARLLTSHARNGVYTGTLPPTKRLKKRRLR